MNKAIVPLVMISKFLCILLMCVSMIGCGTKQAPRTAKFKPVPFAQVGGWEEDSHSTAFQSFQKSCEKILALEVESSISRATLLGGTSIDWQVPCMEATALEKPTDTQAKLFFEKWFQPYQVFDDKWDPDGLLTGYFHIELEGSKKKHGKYKYPVYRKPHFLEQVKGSDDITHAAINKGALVGQGLEIVYVDNLSRLYLMHIQGSGIIKLKEGGHVNLGFEDHNGYRFQGISKALKSRDLKFDSSKSMLDYLHNNPKQGREIIEEDPSYVFFKPLNSAHPIGGHGVPLHPERSLAIDYELYPYGTPVWVSAKLPDKSIFQGREYRRLFIAQDTGGAIRGAVRGDVFFGRGNAAERVASHFKVKGHFYALFPKTVRIPETFTTR